MPDLKTDFLLDPNVIFLNHGSFGAAPKPVFETYQNWQRRLESQPVRFLGREYHQLIHQAKMPLAETLHSRAEDLVFVPNATFAVNLIARSLDLNPGDEILTTNHEYGACDYTWELLCKKTGARVIHHPIEIPAASSEAIAESFWQAVTPQTKLIFLSHITSPTALRLPVELICQRARQAGILTLIDGAHAPGQIPLDLTQISADFYTGNCHKWLLAPKGAGFLYANPDAQKRIEPLVVSWGYHTDMEHSSGSPFVDLLTWTGTHDPAAYLSVPAAIHFQQEHDWPALQAGCHAILKERLPQFEALTGKTSIYHDDTQYRQMAVIELPRLSDLDALKNELYDAYRIEIPAIEWADRHFLRISYQAYNNPGDLDQLYDALRTLLPKYCE